jgi:ribonuclease P/MRP protein subunit POP5
MVRFKNRYLLFELQFEDQQVDESLTSFDVFRTLRECLQLNFGDFSAGALLTSLNVKYFNALTNLCIVRSSRDNHDIVRATASMMKSIKNRNVSLTCVHVSGTIRSCQEAAIRYNQQVRILTVASYRIDSIDGMILLYSDSGQISVCSFDLCSNQGESNVELGNEQRSGQTDRLSQCCRIVK